MGLDGEEAIVAQIPQAGEDIGHLTISQADGPVGVGDVFKAVVAIDAVLHIHRILHMHVADVGQQGFKGLLGVHAALHIVGRVKGAQDLREGLMDAQATLGHIAEDGLLVFVQQADATAPGRLHKGAQPIKHRPFVRPRVLALGNKKAEHANGIAVQGAGNLQEVLELVQVRGEVLLDGDLAHRGAHGGNADALVVQAPLDLRRLGGRIVGDVLAVHNARLQIGDGKLVEDAQLLVQHGGDFVGKAG